MAYYQSIFRQLIPSNVIAQVERLLTEKGIILTDELSREMLQRYRISYESISSKNYRFLLNKLDETDIIKLINKFDCKINVSKLDNIIELLTLSGYKRKQLFLFVCEIFDFEFILQTNEKNIFTNRLIPASLSKELLPHQSSVYQQSEELISTYKSFLIQMPTGSGKTTTVSHVISRSGLISKLVIEKKLVIWLAPSIELLYQAEESFSATWAKHGNIQLSSSVGFDEKSREYAIVPDILFISMTLFSTLYNYFIENNISIGLIVIDEAHRAIANGYHEALLNVKNRFNTMLIGLTATPGRNIFNISENKMLSKLFNNTLINFSNIHNYNSDIEYLRAKRILSKARFVQVKTYSEEERNSNNSINELTLKKLSENYKRNLRIIEIISEHQKHSKIIVFSCSLEHSYLLVFLLTVIGISAKAVDSNLSEKQRQHVINEYKTGNLNVLINFNLLTTGFDVPKTNVVIITRPTASLITFSQMIGRGLRGEVVGGTEEAMIYNCQDWELSEDENRMYNYFADYWYS